MLQRRRWSRRSPFGEGCRERIAAVAHRTNSAIPLAENEELRLDSIQTVITGKTRLPSPPLICINILDLVREDDFTFQDLAQIIGADPSLTAKLLKVANTPYYNLSGSVTSVEKAVAILGVNIVKIIALSFVVYSEFQVEEDGSFDIDLFWRRSLTSAVAAEQIATALTGSGGDLFLIALLQDIGALLMRNWRPTDYRQISRTALNGRTPLHHLERDLFGFDHQTAGAELFKSWNFPEAICLPIRYHHCGDDAPQQYRLVIDILEAANVLSCFYNDSHDVAKITRAKHLLTAGLGFEEHAADSLIEEVARKSGEMFVAFGINGATMKPLSQILQEANEELGAMYHSYELMMLELKQAREKAEALAQELHESNERHREMAYKDDLTQAYNYRFFQEALGQEISRSQRYGREFSLVLFDLDQLKEINDTHGHLVGSQVLVNVSRLVQKKVRATDIFARLGGDEFGIILPETDASKAGIVAEQIRRSIEASAGNITATISVGVTSYCSDHGDWDKRIIFNKADAALYMAKKTGKNRVHVA
ncbi:GGDEF domain-containing protein [Oryzomonas rubra]|uniref:diguanylate cyclase n=1 Tax=Oryzomonas rubra TaxID=2509454 RepID=A0A5A9X7C3_9BACT|nr:GGDEF domain-containing protein [Oryzomonas rubra]